MDSYKPGTNLAEEVVLEENEEEVYVNNENEDDLKKQEELYKNTLVEARRSRTPSARNSPVLSRANSASKLHPAQSVDFTKSKKRPTSTSRLSLYSDLCYSSTNDFKYLGEQFKVGKFDSNLQSPHERMFQTMFKSKLAESMKREAQKTGAVKNRLANPIFQSNDLKFKGVQFRTGKYAASVPDQKKASNEMTFEEKFQTTFQNKLKILAPKPKVKFLTFKEMKEFHENLKMRQVERASKR